MSFVHTERVRFGDLDAMRHLNNVVFLRYFETARIAYLRNLVPAHDPSHPEHGDFGLIFAECHINYRKPVVFDQEVMVHCRIGNVQRSSFRVECDMRVEGGLVAEGYGVLVGFDYGNERAAHLPETLRARLEEETAAEAAGA